MFDVCLDIRTDLRERVVAMKQATDCAGAKKFKATCAVSSGALSA